MKVCGKDIKIHGRVIRIARLDADGYVFLDDPEAALGELRGHRSGIDLFTFMQNLPHTTPEYGYAMEWDNRAPSPYRPSKTGGRSKLTERPGIWSVVPRKRGSWFMRCL